MLCQNCKKNTATVKFVEIVNGDKFENHLCEACFAALNSKSGGDLLTEWFGTKSADKKVCPVCGARFSDYERTGLLGCASCYDVFKKELLPVIEHIQGKTNHIGKATENTDEFGLYRKLKDLQEQLEQALKERRYGDANRLNRQIYQINKTLYGGGDSNG